MKSHRQLPGFSVAGLFVACVWLAMSAAAAFFVARFGTAMPKMDDLVQLDVLRPGASLSWTWVWSQHYEHRMPIPRVLYHELVAITRDFRVGTWIEVFLLSALSLAMILGARRIRGRTSWTDAFFPLLWLHWGHADTLLNSFQLQVVLSTVLWCAVFLFIACSPARPTFRALCAIVACVIALPLCGMFGVLENGPLVVWLAFTGYVLRRSDDDGARRGARVAFAGVVAALLLVAVYFVGFQWGPRPERTELLRTLSTSAQFLAEGAGYPAQDSWPWSSCLAIALCVASAVLLAHVARRRADERLRALGILCCLASVGCLAVGIGWGRGIDQPRAGFLGRYAVASAPILCVAYFAWTRYGPPAAGRFVRVAMCAAAIAFAALNFEPGAAIGAERVENARALTRDIDTGWALSAVSKRHWEAFYFTEDMFTEALIELRDAELGPFARRGGSRSHAYGMMSSQPSAVISERPVQDRSLQGTRILLVHPDGELRFEIPPGARSVRGKFGVFTKRFSKTPTGGVRFTAEIGESVLFDRVLEPRLRTEDAGFHDLVLPLPEGARGELVFRARKAPSDAADVDWSYWTAIEIR